ncbi:hypothetical protein FRB93_007010 [Tulasnella sp. JGI-2019a]|nr:hypothetical protein FRB93_007010 [Tulasnella sp. JGI-2019a]
MSTSTAMKQFATSMTYEEYTSAPFRPIRHLHLFKTMSTKEFHDADWTMVPPGEAHSPIKGLVTTEHGISMSDIRKVKASFEPAFHLDMTRMARAGLLPKPFLISQPILQYDHLAVSSPIKIHQHIETRLLVNLAYSFRLHGFLRELNVLPQPEVGVAGFEGDPQVETLLEHEATTACDIVWERFPIFAKEVQLGLASWLWGAAGTVAKVQNEEEVATPGSVLFTYAPHWVLTEPTLEDLRKPEALANPGTPSWFSGIHAMCRKSGARHLAIYTGKVLMIAIFNTTFDGVSFSPSLTVTADIAYGYGQDPSTNTPRTPFSRMDVCLAQVVTQIMCDARNQAISPTVGSGASSSQDAAPSLSFPLATFVDATPEHPKSPPEPHSTRSDHHHSVLASPKSDASPASSGSGSRKATPPPVQERRPWIVADPRFDPCKLITLGPRGLKQPFAEVDIDIPPATQGPLAVTPKRLAASASGALSRRNHELPSRPSRGLVRTRSFKDLTSLQNHRSDGPPDVKRRRADDDSSIPRYGPVFYSAKAKRAYDRDLARHEARATRWVLNSARAAVVATASALTPLPAVTSTESNLLVPAPASVSIIPPVPGETAAPVQASTSAEASTPTMVRSMDMRRQNKLDAVAQALKKAQLSAALGTARRTGIRCGAGLPRSPTTS